MPKQKLGQRNMKTAAEKGLFPKSRGQGANKEMSYWLHL